MTLEEHAQWEKHLKDFVEAYLVSLSNQTFRGAVLGLAINEPGGVHLRIDTDGSIGACQKLLREMDKILLEAALEGKT